MLFFDDLTDVLKIEEFWSAENHVYTENESIQSIQSIQS